jgi:hypothetical protein
MTISGSDRAAIIARLKQLAHAVTLGPEAVAREYTMRVPAEPLRDADLVLSTAADLLSQPEPEVAGAITDGRPMNQSYWLALLRHDAYAASFQSVAQYRSALIERASSPRAQPEPVGATDEEIEQEAIANADTDDEYRAFKRGAFFAQERISRPTIKPEGLPPRVGHILRLAEIIREVDGTHRRLGAAALAEAILAHPAAINAMAQPEPVGAALFRWRNLGDGKPVQVRECPMCGIAPANVDDCGRFGDPACPYFGVGEPEPEGVIAPSGSADYFSPKAEHLRREPPHHRAGAGEQGRN